MSEELLNPPYPKNSTNDAGLVAMLHELAEWIDHYRYALNERLGQEFIPVRRPFPTANVYAYQPVSIKYQHWLLMKKFREQWDHLVRLYEDAWDCNACVQGQAVLVQAATIMFNDAFTSFETREARQHEQAEQMRRSFDHLMAAFQQLAEPKHGEEPPGS